ncbi:MAG TPA: hypothetical protein VKD72_35070, partial [Gemmataceae bacterium]|nr:hypothetical protein [Gemmataceae bacterium]
QRKETANPLVLVPEDPGKFDALFVWFDGGKASRILARHAGPNDRRSLPVEMAKAVETAWARLLPTVGCWLVREVDAGEVSRYGSLDDRTLFWIYWQGEQGTPRVYTEWREAPPAANGR